MAGGLKLILEKNKLTGSNYKQWKRNLELALTYDGLKYVIEQPEPPKVEENSSVADKEIRATWESDCVKATCLALASLDDTHQRQCEKMDIRSIFLHTKEMYGERSRVVRYDTARKFFRATMSAGSSVGDHVLKMIDYIGQLAELGFILDNELYLDVILSSLPASYIPFISNFNLSEKEPSLPELLNMLRLEESTRKKDSATVLAIDTSSPSSSKVKPKKKIKKKNPSPKPNAKGKGKKKAPPAAGAAKKADVECYFCHKKGHMKLQCRKYQATLAKKPEGTSAPGVFVIENCFSLPPTAWVLDTGSGSHICNSLQGMRKSRKLGMGEMDLRVGNGAHAAAHAVGDRHLSLPSKKILVLKQCYYVPNMLCNIISVSLLVADGYSFVLDGSQMNITLNQVLVGHGTLVNGVYILNQNSYVFNTTNKRKRNTSGLNDSYLWHCRLGHINRNRLDRLHKDGLIDPYTDEIYDICHSCIKGKMTKTPFKGKGVRSDELLGLIHSDVCGPMSIHARGGYSYFVTFTDDFSRYGHVYLMKHKSEVFEKFVEYKNEVENQLSRHIKTLRSDRGGEYLGSEFLAFLRENGILS